MQKLSDNLGVEFIKESKQHVVSINQLQVTEYYPEYFEYVKQDYSSGEILNSLMSPFNYEKLNELIREEGRTSGAFVFLTHDEKFIIKTITRAERRHFIAKMLQDYLERIREFPESKLVRILGVFKIHSLKQDIIIMENLLENKNNCIIFDLKGSMTRRFVKGIEDL